MKLRQKRIYITLGIIDSTDTLVGGSLGSKLYYSLGRYMTKNDAQDVF